MVFGLGVDFRIRSGFTVVRFVPSSFPIKVVTFMEREEELLPPPGGYIIILVCMCVCVCVCVFVCEHDNSKNNKHLDVKFCTYICHCLRKS